MNKKIFIFGGIGVVLLAGALLFYFFYFENPSRQALAHANGEKITVDHFNKELAKIQEPMQSIYKEEPGQLLEGIVVRMLLIQEAKKQGITPPVKTLRMGQRIRYRLRMP